MSDKLAVSITEMAKVCGLSRQRFYQLVNEEVFPSPLYDVSTRRPFFDKDLQEKCQEVRRTNCGINNKPIMFYARRIDARPTPRPKQPRQEKPQHTELIERMKGLGLATVNTAQVDAVMKELYPGGASGQSSAEVLKAVFLHLQRKN